MFQYKDTIFAEDNLTYSVQDNVTYLQFTNKAKKLEGILCHFCTRNQTIAIPSMHSTLQI